ncbi:uncharacterized protein C14orf119 homolog [Thrips palmi]|uniref:Uncharacterized protein C14orf119 homolog n=1 Tax=Thrips palmi TaxID=161013 RepID=A0A6P8YY47_THRPL|nr:uncharacterized protein C14orf119 homolog [Thrips palmi]
MTANECYRPPVDAQLRYTVQWFHEWSEMQRGDFLPVLAQKLAPGSYVNGLLAGVETLSCNENGRPPSLFQCRVKLFRDWFETWSPAEREQLLGHIKSMDPAFHTKIQEELEALATGCRPKPERDQDADEDAPVLGGVNHNHQAAVQPVEVEAEAEAEAVEEIEGPVKDPIEDPVEDAVENPVEVTETVDAEQQEEASPSE